MKSFIIDPTVLFEMSPEDKESIAAGALPPKVVTRDPNFDPKSDAVAPKNTTNWQDADRGRTVDLLRS